MAVTVVDRLLGIVAQFYRPPQAVKYQNGLWLLLLWLAVVAVAHPRPWRAAVEPKVWLAVAAGVCAGLRRRRRVSGAVASERSVLLMRDARPSPGDA
jgi:hypothetical protein